MFTRCGNRSRQAAANAWNSKHADKPALFCIDRSGYPHGRLFRQKVYAHRVIWALHFGEWPADQIDHDNRIRNDNRIANLKAATNEENNKNKSMSDKNKSGFTGVCWLENDQVWLAYITVAGERQHLGRFQDKFAAVEARRAAEIKYGFHPNHGK